MPTVLRIEGHRFYFYSHEPGEPPHIHVDKGMGTAKLWLHDGTVARSSGFSAPELRTIQRWVNRDRPTLQEAWDAFFSTRK
jgi:hypothetical protein